MTTFRFRVYMLKPGTTCTYYPIVVDKTAETLQKALEQLTESHPGHNIAEHTHGLWEKIADGSITT